MSKSRTVKVDYLARVEGEGSLYVKIKDDKVTDVQFGIFEPPRFFEAFLRGRAYWEAPDITARICGICPIAYEMGAINAMEDALDVHVDPQIRALRRLIYCGEWIESHALHVYMLHAPDFMGYQDVIQMAADYPDVVKQALRLKKIGNDLMVLIGGREIHPVNLRVGGFYKLPAKRDLVALTDELKWGRDAAIETVNLVGGLNFPDLERDYEFVALRHPDEYAIHEGRLVSNHGLDISVRDYEEHFQEEHVRRSNALQSVHVGHGAYLVGPLARYNLNYDKLSPVAREAATAGGLGPTCNNPFKSIVVRSVEIVYACEEALRLIEQYEPPEKPFTEVAVRAAVGYGCTEAPRGICYHRYGIDANGIIETAKIVPPTAQNQLTMEGDLWEFVPPRVHLADDELKWQCEQAIRNYDPCISCATHFLKLNIDRQ